MECEECAAPAEVVNTVTMNGVDSDGEDALFEVQTVLCVAGHRFERIGGVIK